MTSDQRITEITPHPYADRWHLFQRAYTRLNLISHHILGACVKLLVLLYLLFCVVFLVLRYALLPNIGNYKTEIEHLLGSSLGRTVSIAQISASWQGLHPHLQLQQVAIHDEQGQNALMLPSVNATISWMSVFVADVRLYNLEINQPELELKRSADGKIYIAGWWLDPAKKSDARGLNWLLSQREIVINNGILHWTDEQRGAPVLALSNVNLVMKNHWQHHQFSFTANPPANLSGPLDIRADFTHHAFSENISDYLQWKGQVYADFSKTDLAAWKSYFDYPFDLQQGVGAVRAWFTFDRAKIVDFTADLKLTDVKTWLRKDLQTLDLLSVSGRISVQELSAPKSLSSVGTSLMSPFAASVSEYIRDNGHQIALTNFSFETRSGFRLPPTTFIEKYIPANKSSAEQLQFSAKFLDLKVLANLIEHFPMPKEYAAMLQNFEPAGQLSNFSVKLQGKFPALEHYQISGEFANLAMKPQAARQALNDSLAFPAIPGFTNLTGQIDADEKKGSIQLVSTNLQLQLPDYFSEPEMLFDRFDMQANWLFQKDNQLQLSLAKLDFTQQAMQAHFSGTHIIPINPNKTKPLGVLDLTGSISHFDVQKINNYLPLATQPDLHKWLTTGLLQGTVDDVSVRIRGDLSEFPFVKKGLLDQNIFNVSGKIVDGKINYLPGVLGKDGTHPFWPILSKIQGKIVFDRESMEINAESGETDEIPVSKVKARIANLIGSNPVLEIDGNAVGPVQNMLHYLSVSPVLEWIGNFTQDTKATGNAKLKLRLDLPLMHIMDAKVAGDVQLMANDIGLLRDMPLLSQVTGRIDFNERGLSLNSLKGGFLGGAVTVVGGTQKDGVIRVKAEGVVAADGVRKAYPQPQLKHLLTRIDGNAPYTAIIQVKNKQTEIWVDSTLQGMALHLPVPVNKTAADNLPLHFELIATPLGANSGAVLQDEIKLSLGGMVNAHYVRQQASETSPWKVISGGVGVNVPAPTPDTGLSAHLELASLNVDELQALMPDKATGSTANKSADSALPEFDLSPYLEPNVLAAQAVELTLLGKKLDHVILGASRVNGIWQANIDSKQISGYVTWDNADHGLGHVTARLGSLIIPEAAANDVVDLLQNKNVHTDIPGLDVIAENVELFGKKLGRLELQAKNVSNPNDVNANEWQIDKLSLISPDAELSAQGKWTNSDHNHQIKSQTDLNYELTLTNAGKLLDRLGYAHVISGGKGKLTGEVSWSGSPYSMDIPSLSGKIKLDLQAGQFLKVEPGAAKLLAVLNLQALPRRLLLDFRDVFSDGFAFDGITGDADIEKGVAKTDNFKMRSVSATVLLSGTANIAGETQDLHVVVVPEVNAGAASVVYGLAVNPVIGLGTFLAQLFLREPLMKAFTFEYQITGPWKEPSVVKLK
ncbi:YhdP family protein [Solimicrobium silvestre]|uniref:YhdP central domain-containing protein n=1 Tax=Solimicrobium silvestre TaxID=2099400 RepID=A0A2S9H4E6_9BURK|nr:YhdP family protein [Solimicrobium silvestre]PRC94855.1 hypothetical protein S2091_0050 [Solimicrobium silvestre]